MLKIDLKCPVEIIRFNLAKNSENCDNAIIFMTIRNLSEFVATSVNLTVRIFDESGAVSGDVNGLIDGLSLGPSEEYSCRMDISGSSAIGDVDVIFNEVSFMDDLVWNISGDAERIPLNVPQLLDVQLDDLREIAGADSNCFAADMGSHWRCICGRINDKSDEDCARCGERRDHALSNYTLEAVSRTIVDENTSKIRGRMIVRRAGIIAIPVIILLIIFSIYFVNTSVVPQMTYERAMNYLDRGSYDLARETFLSLGDYGDAAYMADFSSVYKLISEDKYDEATALIESFGEGEQYDRMMNECLYLEAGAMFEDGDYAGAAGQYSQLADYRDSSEKADEAYYNLAVSQYNSDTPFESIRTFEMIRGYGDVENYLTSMPLQICGSWNLTPSKNASSSDAITMRVAEDSSLSVPDGFAGIDSGDAEVMKLTWNNGSFNIVNENGKKLGFIMIVSNNSFDDITIIAGSVGSGSSSVTYNCTRIGA